MRSVVVGHGLSCSMACGIFLVQGLKLSPALAGGFFTTEPPGKPKAWLLKLNRVAKCWWLHKLSGGAHRFIVLFALLLCRAFCRNAHYTNSEIEQNKDSLKLELLLKIFILVQAVTPFLDFLWWIIWKYFILISGIFWLVWVLILTIRVFLEV